MLSPDQRRPWWRRIQWFDVLLVVFAVLILLMLTAELWLPHYAVGPER
jgi:uncharacterized membrane protein YeiB